jgi:hypothetical protein
VTRDQQIAGAAELLEPSASERRKCRNEIEAVVGWINAKSKAAAVHKAFSSKKARQVCGATPRRLPAPGGW